MKRTLSLILALAMIMSLFTTVSFAAVTTKAAGEDIKSVTHTTYPVEYNKTNSTTTVYYAGTAPTLNSAAGFTVTRANNATPTLGYSNGDLTYTVDTTNYYTTLATKQVTVKLVSRSSSLRVDETNKKVYYTGATAPNATALNNGLTRTVENDGSLGLTATLSVSGSNILATIPKDSSTNWFTNVNTNYELARDVDLAVTIVNGSYVNYADANALKNLVAGKLGVTASAISTLQFKAPASTSDLNLYLNGLTTKNTSAAANYAALTALKVEANAGYIGSVVMPYTVTVTANNTSTTYSGNITFISDYADSITVTQYASFHNEWFYLDAISGVSKLAAAGSKTPPSSVNYTSTQVNPAGRTTEWTETYTAYNSSNVARQLTVTFVPVVNDMVSYVEDGETPFSADTFEAFAAAVVKEQIGTTYAGYLHEVKISNVKVNNGYTLYNGGKALNVNEALTPAKLSAVTMDVVKSGTYYIDFIATYKYYPTRTTTGVASTLDGINGRIAVFAGDNGDIVYEVIYGESVTFDTRDFQSAYKKLVGSSKTLSSVTVNALPLYGDLYNTTNRTTNAYRVYVGDIFYTDPRNTQNDLGHLTYWASATYTSEYSVYVPVTMYGTGGAKDIVVEIVINGDMPFIDVAKNSTFYEYIRYCYTHGIMGGKSATRFDATSSITRAQLVTTLYRMAGSPSTYNSRTLPFTDTKNLSTEFSNAVKWAYYNKIVGGTSATTFAPNTAVTRQAMVKILYGYAKAYGMDIALEYNNHIGYYTDGGNVSASMKDAMNWALDYGLLSGNGNKLNPRGSTSRGAAAKILANFHESFIG
ncbi:MAG: S-layer homology domain-containing protein [Oscillospiraceae bacterium]|nr:S-layer homology domain-containing protein [Oscillospiraceae bacterium]